MDEVQKIRDKIVDAALRLAAVHDWDDIGFIDISGEAEMPLEDLYQYFDDKADILAAFGSRLDDQVCRAIGSIRETETCRDRLFDALMERYEGLNAHRAAVLSIFKAFECDPKQVILGLPHIGRSMQRMLDCAGVDSGGIRGALKLTGLMALYLRGVYLLMQDDSPDMVKVMAALDRDLHRAETIMNFTAL